MVKVIHMNSTGVKVLKSLMLNVRKYKLKYIIHIFTCMYTVYIIGLAVIESDIQHFTDYRKQWFFFDS